MPSSIICWKCSTTDSAAGRKSMPSACTVRALSKASGHPTLRSTYLAVNPANGAPSLIRNLGSSIRGNDARRPKASLRILLMVRRLVV